MPMTPNTDRYFAYLRKSSEHKEKQALSIPAQKEKIRQQFPGLDIQFVEEEKSAFIPSNRPAFTATLDRIAKGERAGLIAWHPDRLSRNEIDASRITYMVRNHLIQDLKFCTYTFENTPEGIWMLQMALSQSQYESAKKGRDVKRGLEQRARLGHYPAPAPLGYLNEKYAECGKKRILPDPERFPLVRKMFDLMLTGSYTPPQILAIANEEWNFKTPKGKPLGRSNIYNIFIRPFYYGRFEYPVGSGNWYTGKHKPMISAEEFYRIQELLGRTGKPTTQNKDKKFFPYRGPIVCGECGAMVTAEIKIKHQQNGNVHTYTYYHCTKRKDPTCTQGSIEAKPLEQQIASLLSDIVLPPGLRDWAMKYLIEQHQPQTASRQTVLSKQQEAYDTCVRTLDTLIDMRMNGELTEEEFLSRKVKLARKKERFASLMKAAKKQTDSWLRIVERYLNFAETAVHEFTAGSPKRKKEIFVSLGSNLHLTDKKLGIEPQNWLIPMRTTAKEGWAVYDRFEPRKKGYTTQQIEEAYAKNPCLLRAVDDVRTTIQNDNDDIL